MISDPRIERLAQVLVEYSLNVQPEQLVAIQGAPVATPLLQAIYRRIIEAGGNPVATVQLEGADELLLRHGNDQQLSRITPIQRLFSSEADATLNVLSESNTRRLSNIDPARLRLASQARTEVLQTVMTRAASGELNWCLTLFPTEAYAQDAEMSLADFADFVFEACHVHDDSVDPVAYWREMSAEQDRIIGLLDGKREVRMTGPDTDLTLSVEGRVWINADGTRNFPDGEIFTAPVEDSVEGTVRFSFPAIYQGREVEDIRLWFEGGKVVKATAGKNQELLEQMLDSDEGARRLGEFAIGTNFGITRFTRNILFDEKIGGTVHMAVGAGYPETGSQNQSAVHWDMICDLRESGELTVDGQVFLKDGQFTV